jgi:hypothetical protein
MQELFIDLKTGQQSLIGSPEPEPTAEELLTLERANMVATRGQFLLATLAAGIVDEATAEEAASGVWPSGFDVFLSGLTTARKIAAKSIWVDGDRVRRNNPILLMVAQDQNLEETDLDNLFRAAMQIEV